MFRVGNLVWMSFKAGQCFVTMATREAMPLLGAAPATQFPAPAQFLPGHVDE
jgi:hypothetical protein